MLDRTIPFYNTILKCECIEPQSIVLPTGYSFAQYHEGYEYAWANLEHEIGDFNSTEEAKQYFVDTYLSEKEELMKRGVFLFDCSGEMVGTCIAWRDPKDTELVASLHWLAVSPQYQGLGLGRAICQKTMQVFFDLREMPVYIHTQPWSWKAILLYISLGFRLQRGDSFSHYENQYIYALETLRKVVSKAQYQTMLDNSQD